MQKMLKKTKIPIFISSFIFFVLIRLSRQALPVMQVQPAWIGRTRLYLMSSTYGISICCFLFLIAKERQLLCELCVFIPCVQYTKLCCTKYKYT